MAEPKDRTSSDWSFWRERMSDSSRCETGRVAGVWALDVLEDNLGVDWLARVRAREGELPPEVALAHFHAVAYAELLKLAASLCLVKGLPGHAKVRTAIATDLREEARRHACLLLELAMLGQALGANVALEARLCPDGPPVDALIEFESSSIAVEARVVLLDDRMRGGRDLADRLSTGMRILGSRYDVHFEGEISEVVSEERRPDLLTAIESAARIAAAEQRSTMVQHPLARLRVLPLAQAESGMMLTIPAGTGRGWERVSQILIEKAAQAARSGSTWLRIDLLDGTWQLTPWSQESLAHKTGAMAAALASILAPHGIRGITVTSGSATTLTRLTSQSARSGTAFGLCRDLGAFRGRETIVVPLGDAAGEEAWLWVRLYDEEPGWLDKALSQLGFPALAVLAEFDPIVSPTPEH